MKCATRACTDEAQPGSARCPACGAGDVPMCRWYALCPREAAVLIKHPVLGYVPACANCAARYDELSK